LGLSPVSMSVMTASAWPFAAAICSELAHVYSKIMLHNVDTATNSHMSIKRHTNAVEGTSKTKT